MRADPAGPQFQMANALGRTIEHAMDKTERKRLKKLGKERVEQHSQELRAALAAANSAPLASDEWASNYTQQSLRERKLRTAPPDYIRPAVAERDWIALPVDDSPTSKVFPGPTLYLQCLCCKGLVHSVARPSIACKCGNIHIQRTKETITVGRNSSIRLVKLL